MLTGHALAVVFGLGLIAAVLWDAFETIVLPRRVAGPFSFTRLFYRLTWLPWAAVARRLRDGRRREAFLSFYGPLSLVLLLSLWAFGLLLGFAGLLWAQAPVLAAAGVATTDGPEADLHLAELRALYEPYVLALSDLLLIPLPSWSRPEEARDNWQTTAWGTAREDELLRSP